jgi:phosphatidylserine synthase
LTIAWIAHLYTALGVLCALAATLAVVQSDYRAAFLWLGLQIFIDATDGALARALNVKERLPQFDGARLDDIIDYLTYVFVPVLLTLHAGRFRRQRQAWRSHRRFCSRARTASVSRRRRSRRRIISSPGSRPIGTWSCCISICSSSRHPRA